MRYISLYLRMVRYRSALVLVLFMLLGAAWHNPLSNFALPLLLIVAALMSTYACATSINDLADWKIDQINLKGHSDRPLITGEAKPQDLVSVAIAASVISVGLGLLVKPLVAILLGAMLLMNMAYSLKPLRISHRPILTPFYLVIGYIVIPYLIGVLVVGSKLGGGDVLFLPALYFLFLARISLKDFRDREGDAKNNKPTFILNYGKAATCYLSLASLLVGGSLLLVSVHKMPLLIIGLGAYLIALAATEIRLLKTKDKLVELISIGFGARIGNGMIFILLGILLLKQSQADLPPQVLFYVSITALYIFTFLEFWRNPQAFQFGNKVVTDGISRAK